MDGRGVCAVVVCSGRRRHIAFRCRDARSHERATTTRDARARPCHTRVSHVCHARVAPQVSASYVIVADMHGGIVAARVGERYMRLNGQGGVEGSLGDDGGLKVTER